MWNVTFPQGDSPAHRLCHRWLAEYGPGPEEQGNGEILARVNPALVLAPEGYRLRVSSQGAMQRVLLESPTMIGLMYGLSDFLFEVLPQERQAHTWMKPYYFRNPFRDGFSPWSVEEAPRVTRRGLWTWGHVVYDYQGYLEHMAQLKLNEVVIWNDFAPLNAAEVVDYAHALGIRVVWGYSWGWDCYSLPNLSDPDVRSGILDGIVERFQSEYASLPGDGIYFQTATETSLDALGGVPIAVAAVRLVNEAARRLLALKPGLELQFGLHATSVRGHMDEIAKVDPRVRIVWEDGGAFPYAYLPENLSDRAGTLAFTDEICRLRAKGGVGVVTKGIICLDWTDFHHRAAPERIGEADEAAITARMREVLPVMKMIQSYWLKNGGELYRHARVLAGTAGSQVLALVEDGLFSRRVWFPVALFADCLWNPERSFESRRGIVARRPDVVFANVEG